MKVIHVKANFGGLVIGNNRILPGDYDITDERLFNAGEYLVANGHAVVTKDEPDALESKPVEALGGDIAELTKAQLVEKLDALGIDIPHNANKAKLVELLGDHDSSKSDI